MWSVFFTNNAQKQLKKLPCRIGQLIRALAHEIEKTGPMCYHWKNFGKLQGYQDRYHCHIKEGRPTYVVCWEIIDKKNQSVEVFYVGTHEKSPY